LALAFSLAARIIGSSSSPVENHKSWHATRE
jgi:hypothetical protein